MFTSLLQKKLRFFAKAILKKYHPTVVGITGSVGKTSAKEAIAQALSCQFSVRGNYKNYNNEIGLPLTIMGVEKSPGKSLFGWMVVFARALKLLISTNRNYPKILVLEMGADKPGDIAYLTSLAPCKVGVLTAIAHAHTEFFNDLAGVAKEKRVIISHLPKDGFAIVNFDNDLAMGQVPYTKAKVVTYGVKEGADIRAIDIALMVDETSGWPTGLRFKVDYLGSVVPVFIPGIIAESFVSAALAGLAVGGVLGNNLVEAGECLRAIKPLAGHMRLIVGVKGTLLIDDTYNSSPLAVKAALATLSKIPPQGGGRRYAMLGDMLELGAETNNLHREVGFKVAEIGIDFLITVGEASKATAQAAEEAGLGKDQIASFATSAEAGKFLQEKMDRGDVILVKGSQGVRMEKIVKEVMAEPLRAKELLVRQEEEWLSR